MTGATMCSGIGAPETALPGVQWLWSAEVEKFPSRVLANRHQESMNLGDITAADFIDKARAFGHLNLLVAGTPCQAFSVAGNRRSLEDARGNLTLRFVEVVDAIKPDAVLWENVPGVLSTSDNAFGCFLAALVGADDAIVPECGWTNAGMVSGPRRNAAWRVFDAQYFGLAQRRKRVFVVACPRNGADPREILFECEGVPRHSAPSREAGETVAGTLDARPSGGGGPAGGTDGACGGYLQPVSHCLNAGGMGRIDCETETLVACEVSDTLGVGANQMTGFKTELVAHPVTHETLRYNGISHASTQGTNAGKILQSLREEVGAEAFTEWGLGVFDSLHETVILRSNMLCSDPNEQAESGKAKVVGGSRESAETLSGWAVREVLGSECFGRTPQRRRLAEQLSRELGEAMPELPYEMSSAIRLVLGLWESGEGLGVLRQALSEIQEVGGSTESEGQSVHLSEVGYRGEPAEVLRRAGVRWGLSRQRILQPPCPTSETRSAFGVRRLLPVECEILMGFPKDYTALDKAADGPRYKALGNSMAVPVVRWIGLRIVKALKAQNMERAA